MMDQKEEFSELLFDILLSQTNVVEFLNKEKVIDCFFKVIRQTEKDILFGYSMFQFNSNKSNTLIIEWRIFHSLQFFHLFDVDWIKIDENVYNSIEPLSFINEKHQNVFLNYLKFHPNHIGYSIKYSNNSNNAKRNRITVQKIQKEIVKRFLDGLRWTNFDNECESEIVDLLSKHLNKVKSLTYNQYLLGNESLFDAGILDHDGFQELINKAKNLFEFDGSKVIYGSTMNKIHNWKSIIFSQAELIINDKIIYKNDDGIDLKNVLTQFIHCEHIEHKTINQKVIKIQYIDLTKEKCKIRCEFY